MKGTYTVLLLFFITGNIKVNAQLREYEFGGMLGGTTYFGELNQNQVINQLRPGFQIFGRLNYHNQLAFRTNLNILALAGNDADADITYYKQRKHNFESNLLELSAAMELNFRDFNAAQKRSPVSPYITLGFGISLVDFEFEKKIGRNLTLPFGAGLKFNLPGRWNLGLEYKIHKTFRDDIDGLKTRLFEPDEKYPNKQIANMRNDDWFSFFGFYLAYKFRRDIDCCAYY